MIDERGRVDDVVRDWMKVLGRPDREVVLVIRRPSGLLDDDDAPTVCERVMVVCLHRRWMAMAARDGSEIVIGGVGEAEDPDRQIELMCRVLVPAFGESAAAEIDGVNVEMDTLLAALNAAAPSGREAISAALAKVGLPPHEVEVVTAANRLDESAMAVVSHHRPRPRGPPASAGAQRRRHRLRSGQFHHHDRRGRQAVGEYLADHTGGSARRSHRFTFCAPRRVMDSARRTIGTRYLVKCANVELMEIAAISCRDRR